MAKNTKATTVTIANGGTTTPTITMDPSRIPLAIEIPAAARDIQLLKVE